MPKRTPPKKAPVSIDKLAQGEPFQLSFFDNEIGGELLNILSKGLYTNPLDAIREYVQNSIDADANNVKIQVTGNSVFVSDDGLGMTRDQLLQSRDFGVSSKSMDENVGFRGIGIYSGFDLCNRLVIRTKTTMSPVEHILVFKFGEMRRRLEKARIDPKRPVIPLSLLLGDGVFYRYETSSEPASSFTIVQLEELSDNHINKLSNVDEMRSYILRNLPVKFSKDFAYGKDIEKALRKHVPGYKSASVVLQIEGSGPLTVEKPNIPDLESPERALIKDSSGKAVAYYWACLTKNNKAISTTSKEFADFAGFVYKIKGFTIGDSGHLRNHFTRPQMFPWWTGEVYVITTDVIPTSARDEFEAGLARDSFETAIKLELRRLQKLALDAQASRRADEVVGRINDEVLGIREQIEGGAFDKYEVYSALSKADDDLADQRNKASDKVGVRRLAKEIKDLLDWIQSDLDKQVPASALKKASVKSALEEVDNDEADADTAPPDTRAQAATYGNLRELIADGGWKLDDTFYGIVDVIDEVILAHLGAGSDTYALILRDVESGLADLGGNR